MATLDIQGHQVLVDDADIDLLSTRNWRVYNNSGRWYARSKGNVSMHRFLMDAQPGQIVDHRNRNTLDNRRCNLRFCTHSQNQQNRYCNRGTSKYKGVYRERNGWRAYIGFESKQIWLGSFSSEEDAARAHDRAAKIYHGEFAFLNFPCNQQFDSKKFLVPSNS
jgi:hypothetical protein